MLAMDNIFPEEIVYVNEGHSKDTTYHVRINASTDHFANKFIKDVLLNSSQLNISNTTIQLNNHHNLDYAVTFPKDVKHFVIHAYFETYFPVPPKNLQLMLLEFKYEKYGSEYFLQVFSYG